MPQTLLSGTLGQIHLSGLLQLAESEELTGLLTLNHAQLEFREGELISAHSSSGSIGIVALRDAFIAPGQSFSFEEQAVGDAPILGGMQMLILDGCRVADDWERLAPLRLQPSGDLSVTELEDPLRAVVLDMNGDSVVAELIELSQISPARVTDSLAMLLEQGLLTQAGPAAPERVPVPASSTPSPFDGMDEYELLEQGRMHVKNADLELARACFEHALEIAPENRLVKQNLKRLGVMEENTRMRNV